MHPAPWAAPLTSCCKFQKCAKPAPMALAPTTSTLLQLALGDAIAMALLEAKGFSADDFRNYHPGGKLGARIKHAHDIMHKSMRCHWPSKVHRLHRGLSAMTESKVRLPWCCQCKRHISPASSPMVICAVILGPDIASRKVEDIMTSNPTTISGDHPRWRSHRPHQHQTHHRRVCC